ncbi:hypothetical protein VNO77_06720 [Canavalia gladiata]|uniref:Uncharacterized protein n=1 Tax=Canavalia gladiata TaxID=3824 RepID=A0AAN9MDJ8_CANGL
MLYSLVEEVKACGLLYKCPLQICDLPKLLAGFSQIFFCSVLCSYLTKLFAFGVQFHWIKDIRVGAGVALDEFTV